jgi:small-conductance mechanosensitive channel
MIDLFLLTLLITTFQIAPGDVGQPTLNALNEFGERIAAALPNVIAALILLGIGYVIGKVVGWVVTKVIQKTNLDTTMGNTGLGRTIQRSGWTFGKVIATAAKWFVYLFFIAAAVDVLQFTQLSEAVTAIWTWLPNLVAFIIILAIGTIIAEFIGNWLQNELVHRGISGGKLMGLIARGVLYAIVFVIAIAQLQIGSEILNTVVAAFAWGIAAALAIGVGVGLAYALREFMPSLITGATHVESILKEGQKVRFGEHSGTIQQAGAFHIILRDEEGRTVIVPTKGVMNEDIIIENGPPPETPEKRIHRLVSEEESRTTPVGRDTSIAET